MTRYEFFETQNAGFHLFMLRFPCLMKRVRMYVQIRHVDIEMEIYVHKLSTKMLLMFTGDRGIEPRRALPKETTRKYFGSMDLVQSFKCVLA